jgi:hypothetical protein
MTHLPWWTWTAPLWPTLLAMAFVLVAGGLAGRSTGRYPTLDEWVRAFRAVRRSGSPRNGSWPAAPAKQQANEGDERPSAPQSGATG